MKVVFFCQNPYAFGILEPVKKVVEDKGYEFIWYVKDHLIEKFPFKKEVHTSDMKIIFDFKSDVIFVPGNEVPHYLRGVKTQVFHGLAGEKKGHFRIRKYFDLYLTQGPYFTNKFNELKEKHKDFDVVETGWPKLDVYGSNTNVYTNFKKELLKEHSSSKIILYAPTFSPSLTSAGYLLHEIKELAKNKEYLILFKFHDLMSEEFIEAYKSLANSESNIVFVEEKNIIKYLLISDLMVSDTSSVVYEFLLLNKPVITFKSISESIKWENLTENGTLVESVDSTFKNDVYQAQRENVIKEYHPYSDGESANRMVHAVENYIEENGVPEKRNLPFLRRRKINKQFGKLK